ncbi:MAG: DUF4269 domain-containing protein [Bacteroidales bacterium]|nr:DUF4269 domain-containing protein [Bacteroidales bacterium]
MTKLSSEGAQIKLIYPDTQCSEKSGHLSGFVQLTKFKTDNFEIEIFGQNIPTEKQNTYRHMLIE